MEREWLEQRLAEGRSLASIAREAGKGASTVAYWIAKHGLVAAGRERHVAKGGVAADRLESLVAAGLSVREIGADLGLSYSAVRHRLSKHGLRTAGRRRTLPDERWCDIHDVALREYEGYRYRCPRCVSETVSEARRRRKALLVEEAGGKCGLCGYDRCNAALEFHHVDPTLKAFSVSLGGVTRSLASVREEARKCMLLCSTCHKEVEMGLAQLPFSPSAADNGTKPSGGSSIAVGGSSIGRALDC